MGGVVSEGRIRAAAEQLVNAAMPTRQHGRRVVGARFLHALERALLGEPEEPSDVEQKLLDAAGPDRVVVGVERRFDRVGQEDEFEFTITDTKARRRVSIPVSRETLVKIGDAANGFLLVDDVFSGGGKRRRRVAR